MQSRFNIQVTETDIAKAKQNDSYNCVVAQAVARTITEATRIEVDSQAIRFTFRDQRWLFLTPYAVQGYVIAFDAGEPIQPFSFQLRNGQRVRRNRRTEAGKALGTARSNALRAETRKPRKDRVEASETRKPRKDRVEASAAPHVTPETARTAAKAAYAEAREIYGSAPAAISDRGGRRPPPRVFKRKHRTYGHRLLRINQKAQPAPEADK